MKLLVDIGNSRIKWAQQLDAGLQSCDACVYNKSQPIESIEQAWAELPRPSQVVISNVAGQEMAAEMSAYLQSLWGITAIFLAVSRQAGGVTNAYDDVEQLGIDRWLAIIAAWNRYKSSVCVVDCGTALTLDVVSASGQHAGGFIVPGLTLMGDALNSQTQQINVSLDQKLSLELGRNTRECISNGAVMVITSLINQVRDKLISEHGKDSHCIITGGYAEEVMNLLEVEFDYDPQLVLNGMALMIENS
jgi:type III pantothenate kinase